MNNAFRENAIDQTEIAKAKLHEEEETKRAKIKEREETKRARLESMKTPGYIATRLAFAGVVIAIGCTYVCQKYPSPPEPPAAPAVCVEKTEIITTDVHDWSCSMGYITSENIYAAANAKVLVKCNCGIRPFPTAAAPVEKDEDVAHKLGHRPWGPEALTPTEVK